MLIDKIRCVIVRGGTSKGIFIRGKDLPLEQERREGIIKDVFGSPDIRQIDGLGGADVLTSKMAIVERSNHPNADVSYTFGQVGITQNKIDYSGNCGNISSGVGPYAIYEGLVKPVEPVTVVKVHQTNTDRVLLVHVPVRDGKPRIEGEESIDGVPGSAAQLKLDFSAFGGAITGRLLPTGKAKDTIEVDGKEFNFSFVDAGNPLVFIRAEELGLKGDETPEEIDANPALNKTIEKIRGRAAVMAGMLDKADESPEKIPYIPFFAIVSKPQDYRCYNGKVVSRESIDITARLLFMLKMHKTYPVSGATSTGAAAKIPGTVVYEILSQITRQRDSIRIGHPAGVIRVQAEVATCDGLELKKAIFSRTARIIMDGTVFLKRAY